MIFKKILCISVLFFIAFSFAITPTPKEIDLRMQKIEDANYKETVPSAESIKLFLACYNDAKNIDYKIGIKKSGLSLMVLYVNQFKYNKAIEISDEIESIVEEYGKLKNIVEYHTLRAYCYINVGMMEEGYKEYKKALNTAEKIPNNDDKYLNKSDIYLNIANYHIETEKPDKDSILYYYKKALYEAEKISDAGQISKTGQKNDWIICLHYLLGNFYLDSESADINAAKKYFETARHLYENSETKMFLGNEIKFLSLLSKYYYHDKNYNEAVRFGLKSLELQKKESDPFSKKIAYEYIAKSYLKLGKQKDYQYYINKYIAIDDSIKISEKNIATQSLENIFKKKDQDWDKKNNLVLFISIIATIILATFLFFFWKQQNKKLHVKYTSLIEKIKNDNPIENDNKKLTIKNNLNIPEETYRRIVDKMDSFEKKLGFLKKDITLSYLSNLSKTNTRSLSIAIKYKTGKNFNNYINDLRINYIIHKLYHEKVYRKYKISYLAEECGFSSSKVFLTAFRNLTGVNPSYFITNLKKDSIE